MTPSIFRRMALSLPETTEGEHMDHPDFRVRGKIFATLAPDESWGMVKLTVDQQTRFVGSCPETFEPVPGGWGRQGATRVILKKGRKATVFPALVAAWRNRAPKTLARELPDRYGEGYG